MPPWIEIGRVASVNPAKRAIRVRPFQEQKVEFDNMTLCRVRLDNGSVARGQLASLRDTGDELLLAFTAGLRRETVASMRGGVVVIDPEEQTPRTVKNITRSELIGFTVIDPDARAVGRITGVIDSPAHDVIEIETPDGGELLVPWIPEVVMSVDVDAGVVRVKDIAPFAVRNEPEAENDAD